MCCGQCCGSGSGRLRPDLDPDPGPNKWPYVNFIGMCKSHKYLRNLCCLTFWFMKIAYFHQNKFPEKSLSKIYLGQDPDPDVSESRIRIRIRSKIFRIGNTGCGAGTRTERSRKKPRHISCWSRCQSSIIIHKILWILHYISQGKGVGAVARAVSLCLPVPKFMDHCGGRKSEDFSVDLVFTPHPKFHGYAEPNTHCTLLYKRLRPVSWRIRVLLVHPPPSFTMLVCLDEVIVNYHT
jgi:hypothetical protein